MMWVVSLVAQPGTPFSVPYFVHLILWPTLLVWTGFLLRRRRSRGWPCSWRFGIALVPACFFTDAAALLAAIKWPSHASTSFVLTLLWQVLWSSERRATRLAWAGGITGLIPLCHGYTFPVVLTVAAVWALATGL